MVRSLSSSSPGPVANDATGDMDATFRAALIESRQRMKELLELSCDFAWETDASGLFSFVTAGGALGSRILHRDVAGGESGQPLDGHRTLKQQAMILHAMRTYAGRFQSVLVFVYGRATPVHPQAHRRMRVSRGKHRAPLRRVRVTHALYPPPWVLMPRFGICLDACFEGHALPQVGPQERVDVALSAPALQGAAGAYRLIDDGVVGVAARFKRVE